MLKFSPMGDDVHRKLEKIGQPTNHYTPSRIFSIEELPMALAFIVFNDGEFYKSIYDGINSGRDTDSIGVMIGVILGARYGEKVVNKEDIALLQETNRMDLYAIADRFSEVATTIINEDLRIQQKRSAYFGKHCERKGRVT
jgi:ADP-ribosylglycohydrolase